jgi:hypothetical protein
MAGPWARADELHRGLVSYYPLDSVSPDGLSTPDVVSGNDFVLVNMGEEAVVAGRFGQALDFNGVDQYAVYTRVEENGLPISRSHAYTVAFWVRAEGVGQNDRRAFSEGSTLSNNPLLTFGTGNSTDAAVQPFPHVFFRDLGGTARVDYRAPTPVFNGDWRHVAIVDTNGAFALYVDGVLDSTRSYLKIDPPDETVSIGGIQRAAASHWLQGTIDEVALWNRALTVAEIQSLMTTPIAQPVVKTAPFFTLVPVAPAGLRVGDTVVLQAGVGGSPTITLEWRKNNTPIPEATGLSLTLPDLQTGDAGSYTLVATNPQGTTISTPVVIDVGIPPPPDLAKDMIAYWPLDDLTGGKTPDLALGYDMEAVGLTAVDVVPGRWGQAIRFDAARNTMLKRVTQPGEQLPAYQHANFSVSLWVRGLPQPDRRVYSEGSTLSTQPLFNLGTHNAATDGSVDSFIRTDTGATGNHRYSIAPGFDDAWHHILYTQRDTGGGAMLATLYVDGVADPVALDPVRPLTLNTVSIGGILRANPSSWFTGEIDDVAVWKRALSAEEAALLATMKAPTPPPPVIPLAVNVFKADLPAVALGDSVTLRWDVSKDATAVSIDQGVGSVTAQTTVGAGSMLVTPAVTTTYTLTVTRGAESVTAQATVTVIDGVATGWTLVDNFDRYPAGVLAGTGWWSDLRGTFARVEDRNGNRLLSIASAESAAVLDLRTLAVAEGQSRTLFFRMIPVGEPAAVLVHVVGLTDKNIRWYADTATNVGPALRPAFDPGPWLPGAINGIGGAVEYGVEPLTPGRVYNVWIDVRNAPLDDPFDQLDVYSVHVQPEGGARSTLFADFVSDRDPAFVDPIIGGMTPLLDKLYIAGNNANASALFDDFYLSEGGTNATVPRAGGFSPPYTGAPAAIGVQLIGGEVEITWTGGALETSSTLGADWGPVPGLPTSPYRFAPAPGERFFRVRP